MLAPQVIAVVLPEIPVPPSRPTPVKGAQRLNITRANVRGCALGYPRVCVVHAIRVVTVRIGTARASEVGGPVAGNVLSASAALQIPVVVLKATVTAG